MRCLDDAISHRTITTMIALCILITMIVIGTSLKYVTLEGV